HRLKGCLGADRSGQDAEGTRTLCCMNLGRRISCPKAKCRRAQRPVLICLMAGPEFIALPRFVVDSV
ncbi:MAG TPA: hypothetical protein VN455_04475, partial [Methanotrichaceae archaeon]|nr:hypothetical protein [Methanotrichaceae archaeon]